MENALIEVQQLPIIAERLYQVKQQIEDAVLEAESMICTPDTIQAVKAYRADLRKQFDALEDQRKAVKTAVLAPYNEFEAVYRECVTEPMRRGDAALKTKVDGFESALKAQCEEELKLYFAEVCQAENIDFLSWPTACQLGGIKISMADATAKTPKKLREAIDAVVSRVADDERQIAMMDDPAEIMTEYKRTFNVGVAVAAVQDRRRRIAEEQNAQEARSRAQEVQETVIAKVDAVAPPEIIDAPVESEELFTITFTIKDVTRAQALRVRDYLKQEGISYE